MHIISWATHFCNIINSSNNSVPPWYYACPIPDTIFYVPEMCNPACACSSETDSTALCLSLPRWHEVFQLLQWVMEWLKPTQKGSSALLIELKHKGRHSSPFQKAQMIYWERPSPVGSAICHLSLPNPAPPSLHPLATCLSQAPPSFYGDCTSSANISHTTPCLLY